MSLASPTPHRLRVALTGLAATSLALAGIALTSTPTAVAASAPPASDNLPTSYTGAPVNPTPYTLTQPDGSTLRVHAFGNHLANGVATVKGNNTLVKGSDGFYRYASGLKANGDLKSSDVIAGQGTAPAGAKGLSPAPSARPSTAQTPPAGTGDDKELVILVQFANQPSLGSTEAQWHDHYFGATGSVDNFYNEASQNQFGLAPATESCGTTPNDGVTGWISLPYNHPNTGVTNGPDTYVKDAITATDSCVDYASYDTAPADGILETNELHITVIGAGDETSYSGVGGTCGGAPSIWGHEWNLIEGGITPPTVDGVKVGGNGYTTFGEWHCRTSEGNAGHKATMGIMAHEFGHDVNWPDLYDIDQDGEGIGEWSLMASGSWGEDTLPGDSPSYPDAWALYYQGWITPTHVTTATNDIALGAHQSLLIGTNPNNSDWVFTEHTGTGEYFLVENRTQQGYDESTPGCGIVVYRVDETVSPGNDANSDQLDPLVKVIQADGLEDLEDGTNRGDAGDAFPGTSHVQNLGDSPTAPTTRFYTGTPSNLALHVDETSCASTMHVDVTHIADAAPAVTAPVNDNFANATVVGGTSGSIQQSSKMATEEVGEPAPEDAGAASVWYRWTAPANGVLTATMAGSGFDTVLGLYTGSTLAGLTEIATNDDEVPGAVFTSKVSHAVTAGTTYQIAADGYDGAFGRVKFAWSFVPPGSATSTVTATHSPDPSPLGTASAINVTAAGGSGAPTGVVVVKEGETVIGSGTLSGGAASVPLPVGTTVGTHHLTVQYGGSGTYKVASGSVTATVTPATPPAPTKMATTTTAQAPKKVKFKKNFNVKAAVVASGGSATGTVQVLDGSKVIGTGTLANGVVTIHITKNLKAGKHKLTVSYGGSTTTLASQTTVKVKVLKKKKKKHPHHH